MSSVLSTPKSNWEMNSSLNSSCENMSASEDCSSRIDIVTSDFYSSNNGYLSPLERKRLKRNLQSSGSDENANPTTSSTQKKSKQTMVTRKSGNTAKSHARKTRVLKPRSINASSVKKRKLFNGSAATVLKNESPKEETSEENLEKYKNNKFFKHGPAGHLRISRPSFSPVSRKSPAAHRKSQSNTASKSFQRVEGKTVSSSDVYDSFLEDDTKPITAVNKSYTKINRPVQLVKNGIVNDLDNTRSPLPSSPVAADLNLHTKNSGNGQLSKSKALSKHKFGTFKEQPGDITRRPTVHRLSGTEASSYQQKLRSSLKQPATSTPKNANVSISENTTKRKSARVKSLAIADSLNLNTRNDQPSLSNELSAISSCAPAVNACRSERRQKPSARQSSKTPEVAMKNQPPLLSSLMYSTPHSNLEDSSAHSNLEDSSTHSILEDFSMHSNLEDSSEVGLCNEPQCSNQVSLQSDTVHDILKDLEDSFNEIDPSDQSMQSSRELHESTTLPSETEESITAKLLFPIFYPKAQRKSSLIQNWPEKRKPKINKIQRLSAKMAVPNELNQFMIDAGQKVIGAIECPICGMVYHIGSEQDEQLHAKYHELFHTNLKFPGWKRERVVGEFYDGRIVMIKTEDKNFMIKKVEEVLQIVDLDLGFPNLGFPKRPNATFLLFISDKTVVGCLVAESITSARRVELDNSANVTSCFPKDGDEKSDRWCSGIDLVKAVCGINRIWVFREHRRKKIATRLLDCLRRNFLYGYVMKNSEIAFSDPSVNGRDFGAAYMGTNNFLVYK